MSVPETASGDFTPQPAEITSALFAQLVMQQANMAMMLLGKVPHPESGQTMMDVEAARFFIDQLEMLQTKTKGNLSREESQILKQSLMNLRLAFVEAVGTPQAQPPAQETQTTSPEPADQPASPVPPASSPSEPEDEHRKKFSKKY